MKEAFAKQLGGEIGNYIRMDNRYPGVFTKVILCHHISSYLWLMGCPS
jgi:hypothetical protein